VDGISFDVDRGELIGYIGPNGAGKSTTIKMLTGILVPTSGDLRVAGLVPWMHREENALNIGVVFGQRLLHDPRVVYLDEPTVGLDVVAKERIRTFIEEINRERGTTVILTTHDLADVERLCRRIILIDQGNVLYDGAVERLTASYAPYRVLVVRLASDSANDGTDQRPLDLPGVEVAQREAGSIRLRFDPAVMPAPTLINEVVRRYSVSDLSILETGSRVGDPGTV